MDYKQAVELAREGKEAGFQFLYEATYQSKYYLALQYMKDEEAAKDVLQDSYVRAFSRLDQLSQPEAFSGWFGRIVANTAKNRLLKKEPMLFSDLAANDEEESYEYQIEDENINNQPEMAYTKQEIQELVRELIGSLPEEQRMCILLFHIEGASIREIAAALDCSENTVKSRLNYGRKNLKKKVEELQKKGYKLFGMAPLPLLLYLLRTQLSQLSADGSFAEAGREVAERVFSNSAANNGSVASSGAQQEEWSANDSFVESAEHAGSQFAGNNGAAASSGVQQAVASGVKQAAASGFLHTAAGKIVAVVASVCVLGGGIYGGVQLASHSAAETAGQSQSQTQGESQTSSVVRELTDEDYPQLLEGQLTRQELEFVLAYGPEEIPEDGFDLIDYTKIMNIMCQAAQDNGMIENYGYNEQGETQYSAQDINRLFSVFTDYRFEEGGEYAEMVTVSGDKVTFFPATLNYTATVEIRKTEYTEGGRLNIYYIYRHIGYEQRYTLSKLAVLEPDDNGAYRIVQIKDIGSESNQGDDTPVTSGTGDASQPEQSSETSQSGGGSSEDANTQGGVTIGELYAGVLDGPESGKGEYAVYDLNGDGIKELLVGNREPDGPFYVHNFCAYTCENQGGTYVLKPLSGNVISTTVIVAGDGSGLHDYQFSLGTGEVRTCHITIQNGALVTEPGVIQPFLMGSSGEQTYFAANPKITWLSLSDRSALNGIG